MVGNEPVQFKILRTVQNGRGATIKTMNNDASVVLWGTTVGAVTWVESREIGIFQYMPDFVRSGIELAPLKMPLSEGPYEFPSLAKDTFKGLPGMLADSLPDKYGNAIIDAWLASQGRRLESFNPVERLCYVGSRGMGALEFEPAQTGPSRSASSVDISSLVELANNILNERGNLEGAFSGIDDQEAIENILKVGTSAGGARAKAIIAWNQSTNEFFSGQLPQTEGFEHWLIKFDGVANNQGEQLSVTNGYGKIEYAYHLMALDCGIEMAQCHLHHEGGRSHFMTKRFDRSSNGDKVHMQTLGAMGHLDYNQPNSHSYEQAIQIIRELDPDRRDIEQQVIRAFFNVVGRNCDDHVKNIAFLMDRGGRWRLSPAYDIAYAWNPTGAWTKNHQMSINGKRKRISRDDLFTLAKLAGIKNNKAKNFLETIIKVVKNWHEYADRAGVDDSVANHVESGQITDM